MSPQRKIITARTIRDLIVIVLVTAAISFVVGGVRRTAPDIQVHTGIEPAESPDDPAADILTCERTLPDTPPVPAERRDSPPVGRITSTAVYECPDLFDGHVGVYIGEVIGDVLRRDGGAWVLINDDAYALEVGPLQGHREFRGGNSGLSVWLPDRLVDLVERTGGPGRRGDVLRLRGVLLRADPADGGGLTFRAIDGRRIAEAVEIDDPLNVPQLLMAVVFAAGAIVLTLVERRTAQRR